jgi:hypothetical protein
MPIWSLLEGSKSLLDVIRQACGWVGVKEQLADACGQANPGGQIPIAGVFRPHGQS